MTGGPVTTTGTVSVLANTGIVANATGVFVNSAYIGTLSANNANNLGGTAAANFVQNTDSRTLSGNLVISGTSFTPSSNTILLGNSTQRWVISGNSGNFSGNVNSQAINTNTVFITASNGYITSTTSVDGWYFDKSFSVATQELEPRDISFSSNGSIMYLLGQAGDDITVYNLSSAWDIETAVAGITFSVTAQETNPRGLYFKPDGTKFYICGAFNDRVYQYTLGTAWDLSTASYESISFAVVSQDGTPNALYFDPTGTIMYMLGETTDAVYQYTLGTAWDVSTASYASKSLSVAAYEGVPEGLSFNSDGTKLWVTGAQFVRIIEYNLSVAWDISTATFSDFVALGYFNTFDATGISGLYVNEAQGYAYVTEYNTDRVYQIVTNIPSTKFVGPKFVANNDVFIKNNLIVDKNARFSGSIRATSSGTFGTVSTTTLAAGGAVTFSTTTGAIAIGNSQTTGLMTLGGVTQTGSIQIGRSTNNQTISIANGATISGNVKILEIGTNGAAGSQTNITIGASLSNTLVTVNANNTLFSGAVNAASYNVGTSTIANATGLYTDVVNGSSHTVGSNFIANSTAIVGTGFANVTTSVNSALLTVGTSFIANTTGAYHTGVVNAASHTTTGVTINATAVALATSATIVANGSVGTAGQVLTSNATTVYWSTIASGSGGGYYYGSNGTVGDSNNKNNIFRVNANTLFANVTFASGENGSAAGPLAINSGVILTIQTGARVAIV
jgi:hypothetical protein